MEELKKQLKKMIFDYSYYDETNKLVAIVKKEELEKLLQVDEVRFKE